VSIGYEVSRGTRRRGSFRESVHTSHGSAARMTRLSINVPKWTRRRMTFITSKFGDSELNCDCDRLVGPSELSGGRATEAMAHFDPVSESKPSVSV
jgi:hypothetical protein